MKAKRRFSLVMDYLLGPDFLVSLRTQQIMKGTLQRYTAKPIKCEGIHFGERAREVGIFLPPEMNSQSDVLI